MPKPRHRRLQELFSVSPRIGSGGLYSPRPPLPRLSSGRAPLLLLARHLCEARARAAVHCWNETIGTVLGTKQACDNYFVCECIRE